MKNEADFCIAVKHSLLYSYKIPDERNNFKFTSKRPFDGIGMIYINNKLFFVCWEAKFLKTPQAFNFKKIESQQSFYLSKYSEIENVISFVLLCVNFGRAMKKVFIFKWDKDMENLYNKGFSIHLKNLNKLPSNLIIKNKFNFKNIITFKDLKDIIFC